MKSVRFYYAFGVQNTLDQVFLGIQKIDPIGGQNIIELISSASYNQRFPTCAG